MIAVARVGFPAWQAHPEVWLIVGLVTAGYFIAVQRVGPLLVAPGNAVVQRRHVVSFALAIGALWLASDYPVHDLAERYLFSVHMTQHLLYSMVVAPLLIRASPAWLVRWIMQRLHALRFVQTLTRFFPAVLLFNVVLAVTHIPAVVSAGLNNGFTHVGLHSLILGSGIILWMPVLSPIAEVPRFSPPLQMLYLFLQSVLPTIPAAFLAYGDHAVYRDYEKFDRLWGISVHTDQIVAGLLMKTGAGLMLWIVIAIVFFRWFAAEEGPVRRPRSTVLPTSVEIDRDLLGLSQP